MDIEQFIAQDHPARALWEFVGRLDLSKFYEKRDSIRTHKEIADFLMTRIADLGERDREWMKG